MTLSKECKALGLPGAKILTDATGYSRQNLEHKMRSNYKVFRLLCLGVKSEMEKDNELHN